MLTPQLSKHVLDALKQWHDTIVGHHLCTAENEGQACCIDRLLPSYEPGEYEQFALKEIGNARS